MRLTVGILATLLAGVATAAASDVKQLTTAEFKPFLTSNDLVLVEFYSPSCGHCKAMAPDYEKAAAALKERDIFLAKVDCTEEGSLCQDLGIQGYPTLKVFKGPDNSAPYPGQRKYESFVSYMTKQSLPTVSSVDESSLEGFKNADKIVVVAFFNKDDGASNTTFQKVAGSLRDNYLFGASSDVALAKKEGVKVPGVALFKSFDDGKAVFDSAFDEMSIVDFIKTTAQPVLGEIGPETYAGYMQSGIPLAYIFTVEKEKEGVVKMLYPLAKEHKGKINFATIDAAMFGQHAGNLNLKESWPAFAIQNTQTQQKYPFDQTKDFTFDNLKAFVDSFVSGKVEPSIKSEPVPETQEGPVLVVVATEYEKIVLDPERDVLIEFYAPWCGHCKTLAPKFDELAALYWKVPSFKSKVTVAKVDATANDVPDPIQGFPTIKLYPAGKKSEPVEYSGDRSVESFVNFIKEHGTHKVDGYAGKGAADASLGHAAPAASKMAEGAEKVGEKIQKAAGGAGEKMKQAVMGDEDDLDHDEL